MLYIYILDLYIYIEGFPHFLGKAPYSLFVSAKITDNLSLLLQ